MILYTCGQKKSHAAIGHACGRAAKALDDAGIAVESLELVRPTLDDVFVAKTGYHLEDEEGEESPEQEPAKA